jgi:hypothetical protein
MKEEETNIVICKDCKYRKYSDRSGFYENLCTHVHSMTKRLDPVYGYEHSVKKCEAMNPNCDCPLFEQKKSFIKKISGL